MCWVWAYECRNGHTVRQTQPEFLILEYMSKGASRGNFCILGMIQDWELCGKVIGKDWVYAESVTPSYPRPADYYLRKQECPGGCKSLSQIQTIHLAIYSTSKQADAKDFTKGGETSSDMSAKSAQVWVTLRKHQHCMC